MLRTRVDVNTIVVKYQGKAFWFTGHNAEKDADDFMRNIEDKLLFQ